MSSTTTKTTHDLYSDAGLAGVELHAALSFYLDSLKLLEGALLKRDGSPKKGHGARLDRVRQDIVLIERFVAMSTTMHEKLKYAREVATAELERDLITATHQNDYREGRLDVRKARVN